MKQITQEKLKILLIDESEQRSQTMQEILSQINCEIIAILKPGFDLLARVIQYQPDVIMIDIELPDRDILENLKSIQSNAPKPMIMFSQDDDGQMIRRAVEVGVSAYVVDGIQEKRLRPILDAAIATFEQYQQLRHELDDTREELQQRKTIEKAKGLLMKHRKLSEADAYKLMRKTAMDQKKKIIDIAESLISSAELFAVK